MEGSDVTQATNSKVFEGIEQPKLEWSKEWLKTTKKLYINGEWVDSTSGQFIESINPANGQVIGNFQAASKADVDQAVSAAREFRWRRSRCRTRSALLHVASPRRSSRRRLRQLPRASDSSCCDRAARRSRRTAPLVDAAACRTRTSRSRRARSATVSRSTGR